MTIPDTDEAYIPPRQPLRDLLSALLKDPSRNSGIVTFLSLLLFGILGGWIEAGVLYDFCNWPTGDAFLWDVLEQFTWIGATTGTAVACALILTRNLFHRLVLAAALSVPAIAGAVLIYSDGRPLTDWGLPDRSMPDCEWPRLEAYGQWGLDLGGTAVAGVLGCHLLRCCSGKLRLSQLALAFGALAGCRSQFLFWAHWNPSRFDSRCSSNPEAYFPSWLGGFLMTFALLLGTLVVDLAQRRAGRNIRAAWLPISLGLSVILSIGGLAWAKEAMPCTPASFIAEVDFTSDGTQLVSLHFGATARLWRVRPDCSIQEVRKVRLHRGPASESMFALHRSFFASATWDGRIDLWDTSTLKPLLRLADLGCEIRGLAISPDGRYLAASDVRRVDHVWEIRRDGRLETIEVGRFPDGNFSPLLAFSPDSSQLLSWYCGTLRVRDRITGRISAEIEEKEGTNSRSMAWSSDGSAIALAGRDGLIRLLTPTLAGPFHQVAYEGYVGKLVCSPDGRDLAIASGSSIQLSNLSTGESRKLTTRVGDDARVHAVSFSPDGRRIVAGFDRSQIEVLSVPSTR